MSNTKQTHRVRRHARVRARVSGTAEIPRVSVFRSNQHVFVQVIDDATHKTLMSSTIKSAGKGTKSQAATTVAQKLAAKMKEKGITKAVFDRGGFQYHGRVKAVAEGLRNEGIKI